jgi:hypothetical protein
MVAVTERWEAEVLGECVRCGEMTVGPVLHGVELGPGTFLCDACYFGTYHGSKAAALAALGPSGDDDGGEDPDGPTPAAPALAPVDLELAVSAARSARPFTHLSELPESERAEYEAWAAEVLASAPLPEPCAQCGRAASPFMEVANGRLCFRCWPTGPRPDRAALVASMPCWSASGPGPARSTPSPSLSLSLA